MLCVCVRVCVIMHGQVDKALNWLLEGWRFNSFQQHSTGESFFLHLAPCTLVQAEWWIGDLGLAGDGQAQWLCPILLRDFGCPHHGGTSQCHNTLSLRSLFSARPSDPCSSWSNTRGTMGGGRWGPNYEVPYILSYIFFSFVYLCVCGVCMRMCACCVWGVCRCVGVHSI